MNYVTAAREMMFPVNTAPTAQELISARVYAVAVNPTMLLREAPTRYVFLRNQTRSRFTPIAGAILGC